MSDAGMRKKRRAERTGGRGLRFVLCLCMAAVLMSGCQLASEEAEEEFPEQDRLIGALITEGSLPDPESPRDGKHPERTYAKEISFPITDESGNPAGERKEYEFEGTEGFWCMAPEVYDENGSYRRFDSSGEVSALKNAYRTTDEGEFLEIEGTVYLERSGQRTFSVNPVYQTADGKVYAVQGSGISFDTGVGGGKAEMNLEETRNVTGPSGQTGETGARVRIGFEAVSPPESIRVVQFDASDRVVSEAEYAPGQMPEQIVPESAAEYLIVEMRGAGADGTGITRALYGRDADGFSFLLGQGNGFCVEKRTDLMWAE